MCEDYLASVFTLSPFLSSLPGRDLRPVFNYFGHSNYKSFCQGLFPVSLPVFKTKLLLKMFAVNPDFMFMEHS